MGKKLIPNNFIYSLIILSFFLTLIVEYCSWQIATHSIELFLTKGNGGKTFLLLIVCIGIAVLIAILTAACAELHFLDDFIQNYKRIDISLSVGGLLLTFLGIIISVIVLMKINERKTIKIEEWIVRTTEIIDKAKKDNEVYIIAPTHCAGLSRPDTQPLLDNLFNVIENRKDVKFTFAFLENFFDRVLSQEQAALTLITERHLDEIDEPHWRMFKEFWRNEYNNIEYSDSLMKDAEQKAFVKKKYLQLAGYYSRIKKVVESTQKPIRMLKLIANSSSETEAPNGYLTLDGRSFSGFFVVANISLGKYYLGTFNHNGVETTFKGTDFDNDNIKAEMQGFFEGYLQKCCA
ncbi:MAG: hypothetical protein FWD61_01065 [Phycisphaerales bacterium]|nr:hypothetical protein [Phycisphaerales bacterium]